MIWTATFTSCGPFKSMDLSNSKTKVDYGSKSLGRFELDKDLPEVGGTSTAGFECVKVCFKSIAIGS